MFSYNDIITTYIAEKIRGGYEIHTSREELYDFFNYLFELSAIDTPEFNYEMFIDYFNGGYNLRKIWDPQKEEFDFKPTIVSRPGGMVPTYDLKQGDMIDSPYFIELTQNYLRRFGKRRFELGISSKVSADTKAFISFASASLVLYLWNNQINKYICGHSWPVQCKDIHKYLLEDDLATRIGFPSQRDKYLDFYFSSAEKMEQLAGELPYLKLSSYGADLLANANLEYIMQSTTFHIPTAYDNETSLVIDEEENNMHVIQDRANNIKTGIKLTDGKIVTLARKLRDFRKKQ